MTVCIFSLVIDTCRGEFLMVKTCLWTRVQAHSGVRRKSGTMKIKPTLASSDCVFLFCAFSRHCLALDYWTSTVLKWVQIVHIEVGALCMLFLRHKLLYLLHFYIYIYIFKQGRGGGRESNAGSLRLSEIC